MPVLEHPRYEAFAQALAAGETADAAYVTAGYKAHRGNAHRLSTNENVKARIAEIVAARSKAVQQRTQIKAIQVFEKIQQGLDLAIENKSHDGVIKAAELMARCLGYVDSPTLTHEHLNGEQVPVSRAPDTPHPNSEAGQNILRFSRTQEHLKARLAGK